MSHICTPGKWRIAIFLKIVSGLIELRANFLLRKVMEEGRTDRIAWLDFAAQCIGVQ